MVEVMRACVGEHGPRLTYIIGPDLFPEVTHRLAILPGKIIRFERFGAFLHFLSDVGSAP